MSTLSPPAIGPDGAYYLPLEIIGDGSDDGSTENRIVRIATDGTMSSFYAFSAITNWNPVMGMGTNSDGASPSQLFMGRDGNFYGQTSGGGAYGFGTFFRLTPGGALTMLYTFDDRSQMLQDAPNYGSRELVQDDNGVFYGLSSVNGNAPTFFKITSGGAYTAICSAVPGFVQGVIYSNLVAGHDGNFFGLITYYPQATGNGTTYSAVYKLTPSCQFTQIYALPTGDAVSSLILGADGNFYAADRGNTDATGTILRISPGGQSTVLTSFDPETYRHYVSGSWICVGHLCTWYPGHWDTSLVNLNARGYQPTMLMQAHDGSIYGTTSSEGLNASGTFFRIAPDGSFSTILSPANSRTFFAMIEDAQGSLIAFGEDPAATPPSGPQAGALLKIVPNVPLTTSISFSLPTVSLGQATVLSWSSTNAQSCQVISDIKGVGGAVAATGSQTVRVYSKLQRSPAAFVAGIQCTAADGSVSNAAATLTIR